MPSLLGLLVPTMTDPRVGRGFAICNRDSTPRLASTPRSSHNADLRMPPAAVILGRKQGARSRANEDRSNGGAGATLLAKQAKEVAGYLTEVGNVFSV